MKTAGKDEPVLRGGLIDAAPFNLREDRFNPFDRPRLANDLVKVNDERSALAFARRYGSLGYAGYKGDPPSGEKTADGRYEIMGRLDFRKMGDPLEWIYAQAGTVRLVLELLESMGGADERLETVLRRHCPYRLPQDVWGLKESFFQQVAYQRVQDDDNVGYLVTLPVAKLDTVADRMYGAATLTDLAVSIISDLVDANTPEVRQRLSWDDTATKFVFRQGAPRLIQVVWWQVASVAVASDKQVKLCKLCGAPFIVTDRRQKFCPAAYDYLDPKTKTSRPGRSKCAALYQKRKERGLLPPEGKP